MRRLLIGVAALALAALAVIAFLEALPREAHAARGDSGTVVRTIRVGPGGVEIDGRSVELDADSLRHARRIVSSDGRSIRIHKETGTGTSEDVEVQIPDVAIRAPHITVHGSPDAVVRLFSDIHIRPGERVDGDVVAVCGSVTVEGEVTGDVVAVCGKVRLAPGAAVHGSAVAVGGGLEQAEGATVGDESVSLGFLPMAFGPPGVPVMIGSILLGWLLTVFVAWLLSLLFPDRMKRIALTASKSGIASFFLGLLSLPMFVILCGLLIVTLIGILLMLVVPFAYVVLVWAGQIAAAYLLGCRLMGRRAGEASLFGPAAVGSLFVAAFFVTGALLGLPEGMFMRSLALFFVLLGLLLLSGLTILGTGAALLSRFGSKPKEAPATGPGVAPPLDTTPAFGTPAAPTG